MSRCFQAFLDDTQKLHGFFAIHQSVIVRQGQIHDGANYDFTVFDDRSAFYGMHTQDRTLRRIEDGRGEHGAKNTAIGNRKSAAA